MLGPEENCYGVRGILHLRSSNWMHKSAWTLLRYIHDYGRLTAAGGPGVGNAPEPLRRCTAAGSVYVNSVYLMKMLKRVLKENECLKQLWKNNTFWLHLHNVQSFKGTQRKRFACMQRKGMETKYCQDLKVATRTIKWFIWLLRYIANLLKPYDNFDNF